MAAHDDGSISKELPWPPAADVHRLMAGELSLASRLGHTALLLAALAGASVAAALLATEVNLPGRTRIALTALILIGLSWTVFATWVLTRRRVLFAAHRIVAARMAVTFAAMFALGALALGRWGGTGRTWFAAAGVGVVMCAVAAGMLVQAHRRFDELLRRRRELERQLGERGTR